MDRHPAFVVVIATKDRRALLQHAIGSALAQTYPRYRVVVVNDNSADGTREYLNSLNDPRLTVIHQDTQRGVNVARNAGIKTTRDGEWVVFLDDDDTLLPGALAMVASQMQSAGVCEVLFFNSLQRTAGGDVVGGHQFSENEDRHDVSYIEHMTKADRNGDAVPVMNAALFRRGYSFSEDINGFESEFFSILARDHIPMCFLRGCVTQVNRIHVGDHLSNTAARRDPASFVRANVRIFRDHAKFFAEYPRVAMARAVGAFKISLRAYDPIHAAIFAFYYLRSFVRLAFRKGVKER